MRLFTALFKTAIHAEAAHKGKRNTYSLLVEEENSSVTIEVRVEVPQMAEMYLLCGPSIPTITRD